MGLLDKAIAAADQASTHLKEGVDEVQDKRLLAQAYEQLGQAAYDLIASGDLTHETLAAPAEKIRHLRQHREDAGPAQTPS